MHIRHRSFMGLMLDGALCAEFATRCAFCNLIVHARAMTRHYTDSHPELVGPARQQYDFVSGLSNLVSGKGQCPMCQCKNLDAQKHTCAVMYQLAAMSGYVMSPEHFPIMPLRKRPWQSTVSSGLENTSTESPIQHKTHEGPVTDVRSELLPGDDGLDSGLNSIEGMTCSFVEVIS